MPTLAKTTDHLGRLRRSWLSEQSPKTRTEYDRDFSRFLDWLDSEFSSLTVEDLQEYRDDLLSTYARSTARRKLAVVKSFLSYGTRVGAWSHDPGAAVSLPSASDTKAKRILSPEQVRAVIDAASEGRDRTLVLFLYVTGARASEAAGLTWDDCTERDEGGQVRLVGKGEDYRSVRVPAPVWDALATMGTEGPVFASQKGGPLSRQQIWRIVKRATSRAEGVPDDASTHWLRHAHASHALEGGASIELVRDTLGHRSIQTTTEYLHARPNESSSDYLSIE